MTKEFRSGGQKTGQIKSPNISTENQPEGAAGRPSDTLDRVPDRDSESQSSIPADYNPEAMTRRGEEKATQVRRMLEEDRNE